MNNKNNAKIKDCGPMVKGHPESFHSYRCEKCNKIVNRTDNYCKHCGVRFVGVSDYVLK